MTESTSSRTGAVILSWWSALQPRPDGRGGDRAALARLRRCACALDAAAEPATLDLARQLGFGWRQLERVAVVAAVLAHVRGHAPGASAARQLGPPDSQSSGHMSWLRFRRMIQAETADDQIIALRRAVALAEGKLNVADLGASLLDWSDKIRLRWIYDFHQPEAPTENPEKHVAEEPAA